MTIKMIYLLHKNSIFWNVFLSDLADQTMSFCQVREMIHVELDICPVYTNAPTPPPPPPPPLPSSSTSVHDPEATLKQSSRLGLSE